MKRTLLALSTIALLVVSCSDDESTGTAPDVTFAPVPGGSTTQPTTDSTGHRSPSPTAATRHHPNRRTRLIWETR